MEQPTPIECQLAVIGSGMAGMAAAVFASEKGITTVQTGDTAELSFASGALDLLGTFPVESATTVTNPWDALKTLSKENPRHPYARLNRETMEAAFAGFLDFFQQAGLSYSCKGDQNLTILTPVGTQKTTFCVPTAMEAGTHAFSEPHPVLLVDIEGLKGFSARQMAQTLSTTTRTPVRTATISFPGKEMAGELNCERMAWDLEMGGCLAALADTLRPLLQDAKVIGLPAILGIYQPETVRKKLVGLLGVPVFEIPTLSPSVTGLRMKEAYEKGIRDRVLRFFSQTRARNIRRDGDGRFVFRVETGARAYEIRADALLMATGRFFGKGLYAEEGRIHESLFDLPIAQPDLRKDWFATDFFDRKGHAVNRAGIETDDQFRPTDPAGVPIHPNLFAAGSVLAHQDWKREKSGAGIAITTAYAAVAAVNRWLFRDPDDSLTKSTPWGDGLQTQKFQS